MLHHNRHDILPWYDLHDYQAFGQNALPAILGQSAFVPGLARIADATHKLLCCK